jgi:hypothetical protein
MTEFAIHVPSIDALFEPLDGQPTADRTLAQAVRDHLLDEWEEVRAARPRALRVYVPAAERAGTSEQAVRLAIHRNLGWLSGRLRDARPLRRHMKIEILLGVVLLFCCIAISTLLDRLSEAVLVEGLAQAIVVIGWVALWPPAQYLALEVIPHLVNRRRYAEFADIDVEFVWG